MRHYADMSFKEIAEKTGVQKADGVAHLRVEVADIGVETQTNLFNFHNVLILSGFLFALGLFEPILAVVHDTAHRRHGIGRDLHQIQIAIIRHTLRVAGRHHTQLGTVFPDQAHFGVTDLLIDLQFLACDGKAPPLLKL